jgi:predicted transcriptional regulator
MKTANLSVRVTLDEQRKVQQLADQARTTPSEVLRALVRAAVTVRPVVAVIEPEVMGVMCEAQN